MKLLTFLARSFSYTPHAATLGGDAEVVDPDATVSVGDAVVVFFHAESKDEPEEARKRAFRNSLKHIKWLANKKRFDTIVLHSFTHLGADNAAPEFARQFMHELEERLSSTGYTASHTPFGWFCAWTIDVYGESLAKVFKEI